MVATVNELAPLVEAGLPARTPAALAFAIAGYGPDDDHEPTDERLRTAIAAFRALSPDEQRRICNGWDTSAICDRPAAADVAEDLLDAMPHVERCVEISPAESSQTWQIPGRRNAVKLVIMFGTTKREALDALRRIEQAVLQHFETIIATEHTSIDTLDAETDRRLNQLFRQGVNPQPSGKVA